MKPQLVFQTGAALVAKPKDIIQNQNYAITRAVSEILKETFDRNITDDTLSCNESGYDTNILPKGISSTQPVILGIVPLKDRNQEIEILNIQRSFNTQTLRSATTILSDATGTLGPLEQNIANTIQIRSFRNSVNDLTSVYRAKSNYLTLLVDFLDYNPGTMDRFSTAFPRISSTVDQRSNVVLDHVASTTFSNYQTVESWARESAKIMNPESRLNIAKVMQLCKNGATFLRENQIDEIVSATNNTYAIDGSENPLYQNAIETLESIYRTTLVNNSTNFSSLTDTIFSIINKEMMLNQLYGDTNSISLRLNQFLGNLLNFDQSQNILTNQDLGAFDLLVKMEQSGRRILSLDSILTSQDQLSDFISADQYYLIDPIKNDKNLLNMRSAGFKLIVNNMIANINDLLEPFSRDCADLLTDMFLNAMINFINGSILIEDGPSIYVNGEKSFQRAEGWNDELDRQLNNATRLCVFFASANDTQLMNIVFKIMMLRDRLRNTSDYLSENTQSFVSECEKKLRFYVDELTTIYFGVKANDNLTGLEVDAAWHAATLQSIFFNNIQVGRGERPPVEFDNIDILLLEFITRLLDTDTQTQWDHIFDSCRLAYDQPQAGAIMINNDPFSVRTGIQRQFILMNRDHRAFAVFTKMISFFKNNIQGVKFYSATEVSRNGERVFWNVQWNRSYFILLSIVCQSYLRQHKYLGLNIEPRSVNWNYNYEVPKGQTNVDNLLAAVSIVSVAESLGLVNEIQDMQDKFVLPINYSVVRSAAADLDSFFINDLRTKLDSFQKFYDSYSLVSSYLVAVRRYQQDAVDSAFRYTPTYGQELLSLYTLNSVTELNKLSRKALTVSNEMTSFSPYYYRPTQYLAGMMSYANKILPSSQDSFILLCGIPYGMIERLGGFNTSVEKDVNITLQFKQIQIDSPVVYEIKKSYPASSFIDPATQVFSDEDLATPEKIIDKCSLFYLNVDAGIQRDSFTQDDIKKNEVESTAILEYLRILYGLDFDMMTFNQDSSVNLDTLFPNFAEIKQKITNYVASLRLSDLIASRYNTSVLNAVNFQQEDTIKRALSGFAFDKIVAIPINADQLRDESGSFLCDIIISVDLETKEQIEDVSIIDPSIVRSIARTSRTNQVIQAQQTRRFTMR